MLLAEYNRLVIAGASRPPHIGRHFASGAPLALTIGTREIKPRGVRRVVTCPYCQQEHLHSMSDLGEVVPSPCSSKKYQIVSQAMIQHAHLEREKRGA